MPQVQHKKRKSKSSRPRNLLITAMLLYGSGALVLYYFQKKFMFRPIVLPQDHRFTFDFPFTELNIVLDTSDNLNIVKFLPHDQARKGVVLYFHGNRDNINRYARYAPNFTKHGYEIWMVDYPGYGKSTGQLSEANFYRQANELYRLASEVFAPEQVVIYGKSLGSGIAAYLASEKACRHLILETPYFSIPDLFKSYAPFYPVKKMIHFRLPTGEYLAKISAPITIFHGKADCVIPYRCACKLKPLLKPGDQFITIEEGSHNNLHEFPAFNDKLDRALML
jgi:uncharacterized protein